MECDAPAVAVAVAVAVLVAVAVGSAGVAVNVDVAGTAVFVAGTVPLRVQETAQFEKTCGLVTAEMPVFSSVVASNTKSVTLFVT